MLNDNAKRVMGVGKVVGDRSWIGEGECTTNVTRHHIGDGGSHGYVGLDAAGAGDEGVGIEHSGGVAGMGGVGSQGGAG